MRYFAVFVLAHKELNISTAEDFRYHEKLLAVDQAIGMRMKEKESIKSKWRA